MARRPPTRPAARSRGGELGDRSNDRHPLPFGVVPRGPGDRVAAAGLRRRRGGANPAGALRLLPRGYEPGRGLERDVVFGRDRLRRAFRRAGDAPGERGRSDSRRARYGTARRAAFGLRSLDALADGWRRDPGRRGRGARSRDRQSAVDAFHGTTFALRAGPRCSTPTIRTRAGAATRERPRPPPASHRLHRARPRARAATTSPGARWRAAPATDPVRRLPAAGSSAFSPATWKPGPRRARPALGGFAEGVRVLDVPSGARQSRDRAAARRRDRRDRLRPEGRGRRSELRPRDRQTCAVYCHDQGGARPRPTWSETTPMACGDCHGSPPSGHYVGPCSNCHAEANATGTALTGGPLHLNGKVDLGNGSGLCGACHGTGDSPWPSTPRIRRIRIRRSRCRSIARTATWCRRRSSIPSTSTDGAVTFSGLAMARGSLPAWDGTSAQRRLPRSQPRRPGGGPRPGTTRRGRRPGAAHATGFHPREHTPATDCNRADCHGSEVSSMPTAAPSITATALSLHIDGIIESPAEDVRPGHYQAETHGNRCKRQPAARGRACRCGKWRCTRSVLARRRVGRDVAAGARRRARHGMERRQTWPAHGSSCKPGAGDAAGAVGAMAGPAASRDRPVRLAGLVRMARGARGAWAARRGARGNRCSAGGPRARTSVRRHGRCRKAPAPQSHARPMRRGTTRSRHGRGSMRRAWSRGRDSLGTGSFRPAPRRRAACGTPRRRWLRVRAGVGGGHLLVTARARGRDRGRIVRVGPMARDTRGRVPVTHLDVLVASRTSGRGRAGSVRIVAVHANGVGRDLAGDQRGLGAVAADAHAGFRDEAVRLVTIEARVVGARVRF